MQADTIDAVLAALDDIIARSRREGSRLGYFATLYRRVTSSVADGIENGAFEDGARMEAFDVLFEDRMGVYYGFRSALWWFRIVMVCGPIALVFELVQIRRAARARAALRASLPQS